MTAVAIADFPVAFPSMRAYHLLPIDSVATPVLNTCLMLFAQNAIGIAAKQVSVSDCRSIPFISSRSTIAQN